MILTIILIVFQIIIIEFGAYAFNSNFNGLNAEQWLISVLLGSMILITRLILLKINTDGLTTARNSKKQVIKIKRSSFTS